MEKIIILDHIEDIVKDEEIVGKECFDKTGDSVKVKKGRGGSLEKKWDELVVGRAYSFQMGEFKPEGKDKSYPYVVDFKSVEGQLVEQAQKRVENKTGDTRDRSMSVSYSKDLVVAGKLDLGRLLTQADKIYQYIIGGDDEALQVHQEIDTALKSEPDKEVRPDEARQETIGEPIDIIEASVKELNWSGAVGYMRRKYQINKGKTVREVWDEMDEIQRKEFQSVITTRLAENKLGKE